ncbi:MAG: MGMT family protein [Candidatus Hodarchaeales archaeon]|jgi:O6-methylguanine-DNA--protein-cysteine methyltransferase
MLKTPDMQSLSAYIVPMANDQFIGFIITKRDKKLAVYANTSPSSKDQVIKKIEHYIPSIQVEDSIIPKELDDWGQRISLIWNGTDQDTSDIPLDLQGYTPKQKRVIETACKYIPVNEYYSYGQVAEKAGLPGAYRFVGTTMRVCRQPWIIPCQRVKNSQFIKRMKRKKMGKSKFEKKIPL